MEPPASRNRWKQIQHIFADVVGRAPSDREERLERLCGEDRELREAVEALLERHENGEPIGDYGDGAAVDAPPGWVSVLTPKESARAADAEEAGSVPSEAESPEGRQVGRYRLIHELGRGAMGVVYRAEDTRLGRPVALKFLSPALSTDQRARARLEREARAASALDHPNICTVYEIGEAEEGQLFLALACYDGQTLEERIDAGPLGVDEAVRVAVHVARGLAAAHRHGIVHRDVKPSNILITDEGTVKLLDFGIARVADSNLTDSGDTLGTVAYMSPEQLRGEVDARADVWALGVVLHEMLTGRRPFGGDYEAAVLYAVLHEPPAPLQRDDVPSELAEIVERCLVKNPEERYLSVEEVEVELERLGMGEASGPIRRRMPRRTRRLAYGGGVLALLLLLFLSPIGASITEGLGLASRPDIQHLAMLPLVTSAEEASIGEGFTLTLTSLITQVGANAEKPITVVPASEIRGIETAAEAYERFKTEIVVSGDFHQEKGRAHITLNLIDARELRQLRTERLSDNADRLHLLQRRALIALAEMLNLPLSTEQEAMLGAGGTANPAAFEQYLKGTAALDSLESPEDLDSAIQLFQWAIEDDSLYALAHAGLGKAYMLKYHRVRDPVWVDMAERHSLQALAIADRLAPVRVVLGRLYHLTGDYEAAAREFSLASEIVPRESEAYFRLAQSYEMMGQASKAEVNYHRAISIQPNVAAYYSNLGAFYSGLGRYQEAAIQFRRAIELEPTQAKYYNNLGTAYLYLGTLDEAEAAFLQAIEQEPSASANSNLGYVYYRKGEYAAEAAAYRRALELDTTNFSMWSNLSIALNRMGVPESEWRPPLEQAERLAARHIEVNPNDLDAIYGLAAYALDLGRPEQARVRLDQAEEIRGKTTDHMVEAGLLHAKLGDEDRAIIWITRAVEGGYPIEDLESYPELLDILGSVKRSADVESLDE